MSSSGFLEIEGGVQPALPTTGRSRLWYNNATQEWYVTFPDGSSKKISLPSSAQTNQILTWNGTNWIAKDPILDARRIFFMSEDFVSQSINGNFNLCVFISGGSTSIIDYILFVNLGNRVGVGRLTATNNVNTRAALDSNGNGIFILNNGTTTFRASIFLSSSALAPTNFKVGMWGLGLNGNQTTLNFVRGCYFKIRPQTNGSNIIAVCSEASTHTEVNMGNILETTWYIYEIEVNPSGPSATFRVYLENSTTPLYTTTITSNIPLGVSNLLEPVLYMSTQGGIGTGLAHLYCDYFVLIKVFDDLR